MTNLNTKLNSALRIALIALVFVPCTLFIVALQTASLLILNERTRSHWLQYTTQYWGFVAYAMLWLFSPVNICLTGQHHVLDMNTFAPIMSNHQLDTDWLFIWVVSYFRAAHGSVKIMLKAEVANIPVLAISFNFMKFISMTRKWEHDKDNMTAILSKAANTTLPLWFIIFPEGTLNWPGGIAKSKAYAEKMGIENHPKHCLIPKSTGLYHSIQLLSLRAEYLIDVTMGYSGLSPNDCPDHTFPMNKVFVQGKGPKEIHMHIQAYRIDQIPGIKSKEPHLFNAWLLDIFLQKDLKLKHFFKHGYFDQNPQKLRIGPKKSDGSTLLMGIILSVWILHLLW